MAERNANDAYYTPPPLTRLLLADLGWGDCLHVGEPCAGDGWITRELQRDGHNVTTADIDATKAVHYPALDFFTARAAALFGDVDGFISNPPYCVAAPFVRLALERCERVAMLLRLSFLEPCGKDPKSARVDLLRRLSRVMVCPRVSFYQGGKGTDSVPPAWFIWEPEGEDRPTQLSICDDRQFAEAAGQGRLF